MKIVIVFLVGLITGTGIIWVGKAIYDSRFMIHESGEQEEPIAEKPLLKYTIENLGKREYASQFILDEITATRSASSGQGGFFVQKFHFDSDGKSVSGLAHVPENCKKCPIILQIRGYAEPEGYQSGYGTWRSAERFAEAGFITIAPDFLGYGESASPSADVFEDRFEKYTTVLNLISAAGSWEMVDSDKIGLWGHSNGGQIALTVLAVTGKSFPTTLWAPVTTEFPYSILYYMDDNSDGDKELRRKLVEFENEYESDWFNWSNYMERIDAPLQLHQGTGDSSVPTNWSREVIKRLSDLEKEINYFEYPGADHNLAPDWNTVVERDIEFFKENLGLTD